jgi:hypothetical protein
VNIKRIVAATAVAGVASLGFAANANAEGIPSSTVPGHADRQAGDFVATHSLNDLRPEGDCMLVLNAHGKTATEWVGMADGAMTNTWVCDDGTVYTDHIFHESHPAANPETMTLIWNDWYYFETTNKAGR